MQSIQGEAQVSMDLIRMILLVLLQLNADAEAVET